MWPPGFGAFLALAPWATVPAALVFAVVVATFRYVSLGSVMAVVCLPIGALALGYPRAVRGGRRRDGHHHRLPAPGERRAAVKGFRAAARSPRGVGVTAIGA